MARRPSVGVGGVHARPWDDEADGDAAHPEQVAGVPVREYLRTRRDNRGALVSLADGRFARHRHHARHRRYQAGSGVRAAAPGPRDRRHREGLVAGGDRRSRTLMGPRALARPASEGAFSQVLASIRTRAYSRAQKVGGAGPFGARRGTRRLGGHVMADETLDRDEEKLASWATSRSSTAAGRGSPTSRSRSRSSRCSPAASRSRAGVELRRADRHLDGLADRGADHPDGGVQHVRAHVRLSRPPAAPYWWANELGGPGWSWFTGWFNVLGLIAIVASVD